jgi:hypothetical protein
MRWLRQVAGSLESTLARQSIHYIMIPLESRVIAFRRDPKSQSRGYDLCVELPMQTGEDWAACKVWVGSTDSGDRT